jgi:hypothetical protein
MQQGAAGKAKHIEKLLEVKKRWEAAPLSICAHVTKYVLVGNREVQAKQRISRITRGGMSAMQHMTQQIQSSNVAGQF